MTDVKLKPCPFCGGENIKVTGGVKGGCRTAFVKCRKCNARTGVYEAMTSAESFHELAKEAVAAWNRRANDGRHDRYVDYAVDRDRMIDKMKAEVEECESTD